MISPIVERGLHLQLEGLPLEQQQRVLGFARFLASAHVDGISGQNLLPFAGTMDVHDLKDIGQAIEEGCE